MKPKHKNLVRINLLLLADEVNNINSDILINSQTKSELELKNYKNITFSLTNESFNSNSLTRNSFNSITSQKTKENSFLIENDKQILQPKRGSSDSQIQTFKILQKSKIFSCLIRGRRKKLAKNESKVDEVINNINQPENIENNQITQKRIKKAFNSLQTLAFRLKKMTNPKLIKVSPEVKFRIFNYIEVIKKRGSNQICHSNYLDELVDELKKCKLNRTEEKEKRENHEIESYKNFSFSYQADKGNLHDEAMINKIKALTSLEEHLKMTFK